MYTLVTQRLVYLQFAVTFLTIGKGSLNVLLLLLANAVITSRNNALTCVDMVSKKIEKETKVRKLMVWSDRCASQFRSRFVLTLLSSYRPELLLEWNYNEAHHGKGPMDGIGGTITNAVFRQVKSRKVVINLPKELCDVYPFD